MTAVAATELALGGPYGATNVYANASGNPELAS
jgi:hypothetical protein